MQPTYTLEEVKLITERIPHTAPSPLCSSTSKFLCDVCLSWENGVENGLVSKAHKLGADDERAKMSPRSFTYFCSTAGIGPVPKRVSLSASPQEFYKLKPDG